MIDAIPLLLAPEGYQISRSVRLRSSVPGNFSRTPSSETNRKTWTWSGWAKRGAIGTRSMLLSAGTAITNDSTFTAIEFNNDNTLRVSGGTTEFLKTSAVYRDLSAWYHVVVAMDTTQATASNRIKIYVNGIQVTAFATANYTTLNLDTAVNYNWAHYVGVYFGGLNFDGYLTEINFIDGQALTASSFGETNPVTGVWQPKKYTGTYGTNGFYLNFSDNSNNTAATIGKDYSGNGNNWTPNNISVTAGATYDSMLDVPTQWADGGNGRGNYCTLNPLVASGLSGGGVLSNGNLRVSGAAAVSNAYARGTMTLSGKFYAEFSFDVVNATASIGVDVVTATAGALNTSSTNVSYRSGGNRRVLGTETAYGASWVANDIIGVAVDTAANTVEFFKNGTSQGVITSSAFFAQGDCVFAMSKDDVGSPNGFANFGQRPFSYTPPTGFRALNTLNLPTPTILKGNQFFDVNIWSGNAATRSIVNDAAMQPDLVWIKKRGGGTTPTRDHRLFDAVRGATLYLSSNTTGAEVTETDGLTAFNANGFTLGASDGVNGTTGGTGTYVGWQWKEGPTQGFDIVTYTGTGANRTIAHSLGVAPSMIIVKQRSGVNDWPVYHANQNATPQNGLVYLNATNAYAAAANVWNSTAPTSSVFSVGTNGAVNGNTATYVAYLFAEVAGFSRFGGYTGNGSADGPFVFCGFRPRFVLTKLSSAAGAGWWLTDTARDPYNATNDLLLANLSSASAGSLPLDVLSNGFKIRTSDVGVNTNGATYIFAAFAENPFKNALAR